MSEGEKDALQQSYSEHRESQFCFFRYDYALELQHSIASINSVWRYLHLHPTPASSVPDWDSWQWLRPPPVATHPSVACFWP